jgi:hypothetical protein
MKIETHILENHISCQSNNMKRILLLILMVAAIAKIDAQTLQFSQVKKVTTVETIPHGKVWKLVSAPYQNDPIHGAGAYTSSNPYVEAMQSILIDGNITYVQAIRFYDGSWTSFTGPTCQFPLWLPEGTTVAASTGVRFISVIEFTVVP